MKRLILACGLASVMSMTQALEPGKPVSSGGVPINPDAMHSHQHKKTPAEHAAFMQRKLGLDDEQAARIEDIFERREQQQQALREKYRPQLDAYHTEKQQLHQRTRSDIEEVLTPTQEQRLKEMHKGPGRREMQR
jgi:Spy/CpxP family protein refolding chaperone